MRGHIGVVITETVTRDKITTPCAGYLTNIRIILQNIAGEVRPNRLFLGANIDLDWLDFITGTVDTVNMIGNVGKRVLIDDFQPQLAMDGTVRDWQTKHYGNKRLHVGEKEELILMMARESTATLRMHISYDFVPKYGSKYKSFLIEKTITTNADNYGRGIKAKCDLMEGSLVIKGSVAGATGTGFIVIRRFDSRSLSLPADSATPTLNTRFGDFQDASIFAVDGVLNDKNVMEVIPLSLGSGVVNKSIPIGKIKENEWFAFDIVEANGLDLDLLIEITGLVGKKYYSKNGNWMYADWLYDDNETMDMVLS